MDSTHPLVRAGGFLIITGCLTALLLLLGDARDRLPPLDDLRMYLIMPDRFDDGDRRNNNANGRCDPSDPLAVQGGDLRGVVRRLSYLQQLGINALWITPVQMNVPGAFHGYWIQHFQRVDPRLGTMGDLKRLVRAAHAHGMRVYLDVVCNHTGPLIGTVEGGHAWNDAGYTLAWKDPAQKPTPAVLQDLSLYHNFGEVKEWRDPYQVLGELPGGLDDLRTEDPRVLAAMIRIWTWWLEQTGCDGFRVDTVKHVDMPFWYAWLAAVRGRAEEIGKTDFFIFGEVFSGDDAICAPYTMPDAQGRRGFDAVFNFSIAEALRDVIARDAPVTRIATSIRNLGLYDPAAVPRQMLFVDNHDMARFLAVASGNRDRLREALRFLYGLPGIPLLYYGTEQGFPGGTGPDWENRESMFAHGWKGAAPRGDRFGTEGPLFHAIAELHRLRSGSRILRLGECAVEHLDEARRVIAVRRSIGKQHAYILYNGGPNEARWHAPAPGRWQLWPEDAGVLEDGRGLTLRAGRAAWLLPLHGQARPDHHGTVLSSSPHRPSSPHLRTSSFLGTASR